MSQREEQCWAIMGWAGLSWAGDQCWAIMVWRWAGDGLEIMDTASNGSFNYFDVTLQQLL